MQKVPLDTLGHPLPPPVRAEEVCRIPKEWRGWWMRYFNDMLEKELDCCVCGLHFPEQKLSPLERPLIDQEVQRRVLNTTGSQVRVCSRCQRRCAACERLIVDLQKEKHRSMCMECVKSPALKKRKRTSWESTPGSLVINGPTRSSPKSSDDLLQKPRVAPSSRRS